MRSVADKHNSRRNPATGAGPTCRQESPGSPGSARLPWTGLLTSWPRLTVRRRIRLLAEETLGEPDEPTVTCLEGITDIERLERIHGRATEVKSWQELLDTP